MGKVWKDYAGSPITYVLLLTKNFHGLKVQFPFHEGIYKAFFKKETFAFKKIGTLSVTFAIKSAGQRFNLGTFHEGIYKAIS